MVPQLVYIVGFLSHGEGKLYSISEILEERNQDVDLYFQRKSSKANSAFHTFLKHFVTIDFCIQNILDFDFRIF